jgi:hypothetical protein
MVLVSCLRIRVVGELDEKMRSGLVATISFARLWSVFISVPPHRWSIWRLRPSTQPSLLQTIVEGCEPALDLRIILRVLHQHGQPPHALLRARRERPCCRAAEQRDERASLDAGHGLPPAQE